MFEVFEFESKPPRLFARADNDDVGATGLPEKGELARFGAARAEKAGDRRLRS